MRCTFIYLSLNFLFCFYFTENKTDLYASDIDSNNKYLNDFINISNSAPEIIDYYDLDISIDDDVLPTVSPEIYPDPQKIYSTKDHTTTASSSNSINSNSKHINFDVPKLDHISNNNNGNSIIGNDEDGQKDDLGHDAIDNIMYIYYGSNSARRKSLGGNIIIVGVVFALAAQILAIVLSILRNR